MSRRTAILACAAASPPKVGHPFFDNAPHDASVPAAVDQTLRLGLCPATPEATLR